MPPAEKSASKTVTEFALVVRQGEATQGFFSNALESVVRAERDRLIIADYAAGRVSPAYEIVKRVCRYALDAEGRPLSEGSTCAESAVAA